MGWLTQYFINPAFVIPGAALIAAPIIIHLINRMRYRKVRFAAMEFLFESQQRNRRRVLIEQLILLLLRILIVLFIMMLLARLILDPEQASMFRSSKTHHLVLLDDSASMRERWGETSAFNEAKQVIQKLVEEGAKRPGQQLFTLVLLSDYENQVFQKRDINEEFVEEVKAKLTSLPCTHQGLDMVKALEAVQQQIGQDRGVLQNLHVVSDFRTGDWVKKEAIPEELQRLDQAGVTVNLVKTVPQKNENVAITQLDGDLHVATAGVPLQLNVTVANFGQRGVRDLEVEVQVDGKPVSITQENTLQDAILFQAIDPGKDVSASFEVPMTTPGWHNIQLEIKDDSLMEDNSRYITVDVKELNQVLIIDGDPSGVDTLYISTALSSIPELQTVVRGVDALRKLDLSEFSSIYMLNVGSVPPDAVKPLESYVRNGGGLAWYMGKAVQADFYNQTFYKNGKEGLFPVPLANETATLEHPTSPDAPDPGPDLKFSDHPMFMLFLLDDSPFPRVVKIDTYLPATKTWFLKGEKQTWEPDDNVRKDGVSTIAWLRNGDPIAFDHQYGEGRVVTFLTSAGPTWNDWAKTPPAHVITVQEMQKHIAKRSKNETRRSAGEPIVQRLNPTQFSETVSVMAPLSKRPYELLATPLEEEETEDGGKPAETVKDLEVAFRNTDVPGVYTMTMPVLSGEGKPVQKRWAVNVPTTQSDLALAETATIADQFEEGSKIQIQEPGDLDWIEGENVDQDVRYLLVALLVIFLVLEQLMAYRLSYHSKPLVQTKNKSKTAPVPAGV